METDKGERSGWLFASPAPAPALPPAPELGGGELAPFSSRTLRTFMMLGNHHDKTCQTNSSCTLLQAGSVHAADSHPLATPSALCAHTTALCSVDNPRPYQPQLWTQEAKHSRRVLIACFVAVLCQLFENGMHHQWLRKHRHQHTAAMRVPCRQYATLGNLLAAGLVVRIVLIAFGAWQDANCACGISALACWRVA